MAHTTQRTQTNCELKIYFNLRNTGANTLAHNYFGSYKFYVVESTTKRDLQDLIYKSNHVNGRDVYSCEDLRDYRFNGNSRTDEQNTANLHIRDLLRNIANTLQEYDEDTVRERFGTPDTSAEQPTARPIPPRQETYTVGQTTTVDTHWMSVDDIYNHIRNRNSYHSNGQGSQRSIVAEGMAKIPAVNGVKTSIAMELEMGMMNSAQQRAFAQVLYNHNVVVNFESDSTVQGGEYPTEPMEINKFIEFAEDWQNMIKDNHIDMTNAGAHITIGKSNATASEQDLKIRLSRYSLLIDVLTSIDERTRIFGRNYANWAQRITTVGSGEVRHGASFCTQNRVRCFEFRLSHYKMDVKATVRILNEIANVVFYRKPTENDFARFCEIVGEEKARLRNEQGDPV